MSKAAQPTCAVAAIVFDDQDRVLLIQRGKEPGLGLWTVPGGRVELGETTRNACIRELGEETGLQGQVVDLVEVVERFDDGNPGGISYHFVILDYLVVASGEARVGSDAANLGYFALDAIGELATTDGLLPVLGKALERHRALAIARRAG